MASLIILTSILGVFLAIYAFPLWHIQWIGTLLYYFYIRASLPFTERDRLFAPVIRLTRCSPFAMDLNGHKSNSTYFTDADISSAEVVARLGSRSFRLRRSQGRTAFPRLGAVGGVFLKEIRLFQKYRTSSKILAWDSKWFYVATKFESLEVDKKLGERRVFAILTSKFVFKEGRVTVSPEALLEESGLIPKPENEEEKGVIKENGFPDHASEGIGEKKLDLGTDWSRERIEKERQRGMDDVKVLLAFETNPSLNWDGFGNMKSLW